MTLEASWQCSREGEGRCKGQAKVCWKNRCCACVLAAHTQHPFHCLRFSYRMSTKNSVNMQWQCSCPFTSSPPLKLTAWAAALDFNLQLKLYAALLSGHKLPARSAGIVRLWGLTHTHIHSHTRTHTCWRHTHGINRTISGGSNEGNNENA